tara:strand:+ start:23677 stop:24159 length:483 start_codon:yes stop_codon:yes gene_type:complete
MHNKQNNRESKTYVQGLRPFGSTLPRGVKGILKRNGYNYSEIINKWKKLVGEEIASCSYPKSIKMKNGDSRGTLVLAIKRGDEINVEYSKENIINKINSHFGYKLIDEIKLQSFNTEIRKKNNKKNSNNFNKDFEKKINKIENKNIRNSLSDLLKAIKNE